MKKPDTEKFTTFEQPPLIETVFGYQFDLIETLEQIHLASFRSAIKPSFPKIQGGVPILQPVRENFDLSRATEIDESVPSIGDLVKLGRLWLSSEDDSRLVQIQRDRFLYNWKIGAKNAAYPRYEQVKGDFETMYDKFVEVLGTEGLPAPNIRQFELTYLNKIKIAEGMSALDVARDVFPKIFGHFDFNRLQMRPANFDLRFHYDIPDSESRLRVKIDEVRTRSDLSDRWIRLDLTLRGYDDLAPSYWFDSARSWIMNAFLDITSSNWQKEKWKSRDE